MKLDAEREEQGAENFSRAGRAAAGLTLLVFAIALVLNAWLCDDAYITLRTVSNFCHGLGLTWDPDERVQTYTHPLWMLVLALHYRLTGEEYYSTLLAGAEFSLAAAALLALVLAPSARAAVVGVALLALSKNFVDYSSSGLENPLTHFLLILFLIVAWRGRPGRRGFFYLCLIAGLAMTNRMDTILLLLPALAVRFWQERGRGALAAGVAGFLPFLLWEAFAVVYYGSPFPNTAYAKLGNGLAMGELAEMGTSYFRVSFQLDHVALPVIALGAALPLAPRYRRYGPAALGIALYLLYLVGIGGDFMAGRFLAAPFVAAAAILIHHQALQHR